MAYEIKSLSNRRIEINGFCYLFWNFWDKSHGGNVFRNNVHSGKCPFCEFGEKVIEEIAFGEMSIRGMVFGRMGGNSIRVPLEEILLLEIGNPLI